MVGVSKQKGRETSHEAWLPRGRRGSGELPSSLFHVVTLPLTFPG